MASYPPPIENLPTFNSLVFTEAQSQSSSSQPSNNTGTGNAPTGAVIYFYGDVAPKDWLFCYGQEYDTTKYSELFSILGSNKTPDLRGVFIRGSGINSTYVNANDVILRGQGVGLYEYDALGYHYHTYDANRDNLTIKTGTTMSTGGIFNRLEYVELNGTKYEKNDEMNMNYYQGLETSYVGGNETYPANVAMNYIIRT
jgi:microcystin-dependent protein